MDDDALLCIGQKAFIDKAGEILVLVGVNKEYDLPGGKVLKGETDFKEALKREVSEETNLVIEVLEPFNVWYHEWPKGHRSFGKKACVIDYKCKYLSGEIKLSDEHSKYFWVNRENYQKFLKKSDTVFKLLKNYFGRE